MSDTPQLRMYFARFYDLPDLSLPAGVTLRTYEPGDEERWASVLQRAGDLGEWSAERARRMFSGPRRVNAGGIHFLVVDGKEVATACVQVDDGRPDLPELGYVGVVPEFAGTALVDWSASPCSSTWKGWATAPAISRRTITASQRSRPTSASDLSRI